MREREKERADQLVMRVIDERYFSYFLLLIGI